MNVHGGSILLFSRVEDMSQRLLVRVENVSYFYSIQELLDVVNLESWIPGMGIEDGRTFLENTYGVSSFLIHIPFSKFGFSKW